MNATIVVASMTFAIELEFGIVFFCCCCCTMYHSWYKLLIKPESSRLFKFHSNLQPVDINSKHFNTTGFLDLYPWKYLSIELACNWVSAQSETFSRKFR